MGNIPEETTSFVGRGTELVQLARALEEHRLITLTGSGGVGKTRLALRAAEAARGSARYPDGVWWADLSPLYDERSLLSAVSDAVGLWDHSLRTPVEALCEWLADRRVLLVLDSCERVADACRHLVGELLTAAPGLTVLTTSRQPLDGRDEHRLDVGPLPLEADDEILQLFRDRAAASAPRLSLDDPGTAAAAVQICHRLEGVPLAVELACAQLDNANAPASIEHMADLLTSRLRSRLDTLVHDTGWPQRHRALRTAIGWSHELCAPLERLLWARLSVFRGAIGAADAAAVCAGGPLTPDAVDRALAGLVAQSVLSREGGRFRMLDTIREYGAMWLAELGEEKRLADRHAAHFAGLARRAHTGWIGPEQVTWYARITESHADLCAALNHLLDTDPEAAVEMAGRVGFYWTCCGHLHEARIYLERALDGARTRGPHRTRALWALGVTVMLQGDHESAHRLGERCTKAAWRDRDPESMLSAAYLLSLTCLMMGRAQAGFTVSDRALRERPAGPFDSPSQLRCRLVRIFALTALGRLDESRAEATELRRVCMERGECWTRAYTDYQLALVHLLQNRPYEAEAHARSMVSGKEELGDSFGIALGLDLLAAAVAAQGDGERAAYAYGTGQAFWRMVGHPQRGTPELATVRAECERQARAAAGNPAYEDAFHRGMVDDGESGLARALQGHFPEP
ncbi:ATP-binding protein [Streptomyces paludis]|uniref:Regulator n=1 Tax=Streptomyces paludis TaxID=2282738 RepID=A0A345I0E9_9ACTN|nr:NB-ARC domain-containing protein [Streptomyces paludis]AXG82423.1 regulator [Streptomyces paludis]